MVTTRFSRPSSMLRADATDAFRQRGFVVASIYTAGLPALVQAVRGLQVGASVAFRRSLARTLILPSMVAGLVAGGAVNVLRRSLVRGRVSFPTWKIDGAMADHTTLLAMAGLVALNSAFPAAQRTCLGLHHLQPLASLVVVAVAVGVVSLMTLPESLVFRAPSQASSEPVRAQSASGSAVLPASPSAGAHFAPSNEADPGGAGPTCTDFFNGMHHGVTVRCAICRWVRFGQSMVFLIQPLVCERFSNVV